MFLLFAQSLSAEHGAWLVTSIVNNSDLQLENAEALYGSSHLHEPITQQLRSNSSEQTIPVDHLDSSVGDRSQGFNTVNAYTLDGKKITVRFDGQRTIRVDRDREQASAVTQGLGKNSTQTQSMARVELVSDDADGNPVVASSDVQPYTVGSGAFSIVLSGSAGNYSVSLQK